MKNSLIVLAALNCLVFYSCKKEDESKNTKLLTSKTWGQPAVIHRPANIGFWTETSCPAGSSTNFNSNRNYTFYNHCFNSRLDGKWNWNIIDKEIKIDTYINGVKQKTFILTIVELSDSLLHTKEREESEPIDNYYELKYKPRTE